MTVSDDCRIRARRIDEGSALRDAFLRALKRRVDARPAGTVTLPTGRHDAGEVAKVLQAVESARRPAGGR
jgi:hypothetical protein